MAHAVVLPKFHTLPRGEQKTPPVCRYKFVSDLQVYATVLLAPRMTC